MNMILGLVGRRAMRDMVWGSVHRIVLEMAATVHTSRGERINLATTLLRVCGCRIGQVQ